MSRKGDAEILARIRDDFPTPPSEKALRHKYGIGSERAARLWDSTWKLDIPSIISAREDVSSPRVLHEDMPQPISYDFADWGTIQVPLLVISDLHVPLHDPKWIGRVVDAAVKRRIRNLLIAGDLFDFSNISHWGGEHHWSTEDEVSDAVKVVEFLENYMDTIHILTGNHDDRLAKRLDKEMSTERFIKFLFNHDNTIHVLPHQQVFVGDNWIVAHPGQYGQNPEKPVYNLVEKYERSIAIAHTHKVGMSRTRSGTHWAVEIGMMADIRHIFYVNHTIRTNPLMQQGALIIDSQERPLLLHPELDF